MREGWQTVKLGEVCEVQSGGTPLKGKREYWDGDVAWYTSGELNFTYTTAPKSYITIDGVNGSNAKLFPEGSLLVGMYDTAALKMSILDREATFNQAIAGLKPSGGANLVFVKHAIEQQKTILLKERRGVRQKNLSLAKIKEIQIPLPPLAEQERIVSILDKAFEGIDKAIAQTEQSLASARELFESYLNNIFTQKGDDWVEKKLVDVCKFSSGGTPSKKTTAYWSGKIPWVSGKDMKRDRIKDAILHISESAIADNKARIAKIGSLLILVRGMGLANGVAIAELTAPCSFNQDIKAIDPDPEVYSRFLLFSLKSSFSDSAKILSSAAHGTLKIEMDRLKVTPVSLPDYPQQKAIVTQLDALSDSIKQLEALYTQKLNDLKELKQSLLQQAFAGELTKEDAA